MTVSSNNFGIIQDRFPKIFSDIQSLKSPESFKIKQVIAKNGLPTLVHEENGKVTFIHSKYNPKEEADQFVLGYPDIGRYQHLIFFGVGLGYHIESFMNKFPHFSISLVEPSLETLYYFFLKPDFQVKYLPKIKRICLASDLNEIVQMIRLLNEETFFVSLPSYIRIYQQEYQQFNEIFQQIAKARRVSLRVNANFEKKWAINTIQNFHHILATPSIFDCAESFANKPALIVAAGPSLPEEIPQLRRIKDEGLAYIFAAGSGLVPLLNHNIIPDAVCAYDPNNAGKIVFQKLLEEGLDCKVPLIFGSSVGSEIPNLFQGQKFHFINSQDTVAPFYLKLKDGKSLKLISDSSTVSAILVQILSELGCNPIIFVGQNLAYKNNQSYAQGIGYYYTRLTNEQQDHIIQIEDVTGGSVDSCEDYIIMRDDLALYIKSSGDREFYNTTQGGAKIEGAPFIPLKDLLMQKLTQSVVSSNWIDQYVERYDQQFMDRQRLVIGSEFEKIKFYEETFRQYIESFNKVETLNITKLTEFAVSWGESLKCLFSNQFYQVFLKRMLRVEVELLENELSNTEFETDTAQKYHHILDSYAKFSKKYLDDLKIVIENIDNNLAIFK